MPRILVTGGAGYVGSHICKALSRVGHSPVVLDNLFRGHREFVQWGPFVEADINDTAATVAAIEEHAVEAVIHCAALAYVAESTEAPSDYYHTNVSGTVRLLQAMRETGVDRLVFSSSCAVYGIPDAIPMVETARLSPISPYGWSKLMVEQILADCARAYGLKSVALRYFNAAGADPDGEIGESHDPETHLIPNVLKAAADGSSVLSVYGDDFKTPDGTAVRDYIHVADLADAHVLALEYAKTIDQHDVFNLGTGGGASVREVIAAVENVTGDVVSAEIRPRREGDPDCLVADSQKAKRVLGWTPKVSDLTTIVKDAWAFETSPRAK